MKEDKKSSYFAVERRRRKRNVMIIIPIVVAAAVAIVALASMPGSVIQSNMMVSHNHVRLNVTLDGRPVTVPAHIGMSMIGSSANPLLYGDHSLDKFGMSGMSPLHTHNPDGIIHVESNAGRNFTLGEFLDVWQGLDINGKNVIATVDGKQVFDFRNIILKDGEAIKLDIKS